MWPKRVKDTKLNKDELHAEHSGLFQSLTGVTMTICMHDGTEW